MTFATDAHKAASERFFLVRITARKYVGTGSITGNPNEYLFNATPGLNVIGIVVNGVNESIYDYDITDGGLLVTSTKNLANASNVMTIDHDIYLTGTKVRETASIAGIPDAKWMPLIENYPEFSQSMRDLAEGVFSLSGTDISLICTDRWGQNLLEQYDSLSKAPVSVWVCIDSVNSNRKIFDGEVSAVSYSYGKLSLKILDTFQKLTNTASFGTREQSHIYTGNGSQYPLPADENAIIPIAMGKSSPFSLGSGYRHVDSFGSPPGACYHLNKGMKAKLISPQAPNQTSNTTWMLGRIVGTDIKRINFGSFVGNTYIQPLYKAIQTTLNFCSADPFNPANSPTINYTEAATFYIRSEILFCQVDNINNFTGEIGDYIPASYFSSIYDSNRIANMDGGFICGYGAGLFGSYNLAIYIQDFSSNSIISGPVSGPSTVGALSIPNNLLPSSSIFVEAGNNIDYNFDAFYLTLSLNPLSFKSRFSSSTRYLPHTISLGPSYTLAGKTVRNVTATIPASSIINISGSQVVSRFSPNQSMSHGEAMKFICKASGLETNDASFTTADTELSANVSMAVPLESELAEFPSYLEVAQAVSKSTLGILRVNQNRQVEYELLKSPGSMAIDSVKSKINMLDGDTSTNVQFQDIVTSVEFENKQLYNLAALSGSGPKAVVDLPIMKQLHRVDRSKTVYHVLESIQNRKAAIAGYLSNPTVEYNLATASEDLASSIGDVVEVNNTATANTNQTAVGLIVSLDQAGSKTSVKINEVRGIS